MEKSVQVKNQNLNYILKISKRSKNIKLSVHPEGICVATAPRNIPLVIVENFIIQKADWIKRKIDYFSKFKGNSFKKGTHEDYLKYKKEAHFLVKNRIEYFNTFYNHKWNNIVIRNQSTRWGSCSKKGNLNFNYKIALLPPKAADYIIVHELCHLKEFNHSRNFWDLVAQTIPDYKEIRKQLKSNGFTLE